MTDTDLTVINTQTPAQFKVNHNQLISFVKSQLKESKNIANGESGDYGIIPYTKKKSLLKPGAEKLLKLFGLSAKLELVSSVEDWEHKFVSYRYKCVITHIASGNFIADATRSCNNKEKKHATKDVYDVANTIESVAQKRALVAATVQATMATEIFDADVSENDEVAPNRSVTREEDPRRNRITMGLWRTAGEHGWNDEWVHRAIKKKWDLDSITNCSNDQIEELKEFIETKYKPVGKGNKPELIDSPKVAESGPIDTVQPTDEPVEGDVIDEAAVDDEGMATCHTCLKKYLPEETDLDPEFAIYYCSKKCKDEYYPKTEKKQYPWEKK